ncbi:hypothetical protein LINPERPRIM_LOCUS9887 [Linum perenne]
MGEEQVLPSGEPVPVPVPVPSLIPVFDDEELVLERERLEKPRTKAEAWKQYSKKLTIRNATVSLEEYNKSKGVHYVLEESETPMYTDKYLDSEHQCAVHHSNFMAKKVDDLSGKSELFFVETRTKEDGYGLDIVTCCIIDPADITDPSKVRDGCLHCPCAMITPVLYHPVGLHKYGKGERKRK